jgi:hypothetical protein
MRKLACYPTSIKMNLRKANYRYSLRCVFDCFLGPICRVKSKLRSNFNVCEALDSVAVALLEAGLS